MKKNWIQILSTIAVISGVVTAQAVPSFTIAVSEYPSWSGTFLTACDIGLINGEKGKLGPIEKKWNVDLEVKDAD
jgi:hypothetical protein